MTINILAPVKINTFLHITGKTLENYHTLQSHVLFGDIGDNIVIEESDSLKLSFNGPFSQTLTAEDNLITRAVKTLSVLCEKDPFFDITLEKNVPIGAGLGGGSSDAAAVIKTLLKFWNISPPSEDLDRLLLSLGADVPVCFKSQSYFVEGIGEQLRPVLCDAIHAVLIYPDQQTVTKDVFSKISPPYSHAIEIPASITVEFLKDQQNNMTEAAIKISPLIRSCLKTLEEIPEITLARMSGSGSTCFGLCNTKEQAHKISKTLQERYPSWWIKAVTLQ